MIYLIKDVTEKEIIKLIDKINYKGYCKKYIKDLEYTDYSIKYFDTVSWDSIFYNIYPVK